MDYYEFIESKRHTSINHGIEPICFNDKLFDFQKHILDYIIRKGRGAVFLDTGLGKTPIELNLAENYVKHTNKPVLIITPLAVAGQHLKESVKFGIDDVEHTKDGKFKKKIILINYERLHYVNPNDFDCVILDESSILKNFDGATKQQITTFLKKVKYRFLFTATPAPNDYIELGTSSEALGYLGYMDMLSKFFKNNQNNAAKLSQISKARQGEEFYLKPHAEKDFWRWIASWSISAKKPSDLGFNDDIFTLPKLHEKYGFEYHNRITIWKEPLKVRMRTMVQSLMHKFIVEDATKCFTAMPDYVLIFKKRGENLVPVIHPNGLNDYPYFGETPFLPAHIETYGDYTTFRHKWIGFTGDQKENKLSHLTWQRYASSVWDDVRIDNVLPFQDSREEDDEKHVHALQLDVIDRLVYLYSNPGEIVLTPFMGVGSEVYSPVSMGRKAIGIELKDSYFKQANLNVKMADKRFVKNVQQKLF